MSGYPPEMQEFIHKVEATRTRRLKETFPAMSMEEREAILEAFHPDYKDETFHAIRVGVSKGQRMPIELADIVEGRPHISPDFDLSASVAETDVLVIGGGGAGASAALLAQENGARVTLVTKLRFGDANTIMAQGGIQAADRPNDNPAIHYLDVIGGGHFTNVPELVEALVVDAPFVIKWLEDLGVMFDKKPDGTMMEEHGGGTSRKRMHSARDYSGAEIMRTLRDEVRNREEDGSILRRGSGQAGLTTGITVIEFAPAVELVLDDEGQIAGAVVVNLETGAYLFIKAKSVVLATGGGGRLHYQGFPTTNHHGATADGVVLAYRVGAPLGYLESMQYHPTGAAFPEQIVGLLVTEKVRGLGAQPVNKNGEQFVYPLEPRDVEAAALIRECAPLPSPPELGGAEGGRGGRGNGTITPTGQPGVWLDSPMIEILHGPGTIQRALPAMVRQFGRFEIDITKEPMLVYPTLHYQNGGVQLQADCSTGIPGLFIAGEVSGGVHGHNRLMGNSLLEITVFGRRAGRSAAAHAQQVKRGKPTLAHVEAWNRELEEAGVDTGVVSPILLPDYTRHV